MKRFIWGVLVLLAFTACKKDKDDKKIELNADSRYTFEVEIKGKWTAETHPTDYPADAKFGKIVGISHEKENLLFQKENKAPSWMASYFESEDTNAFTNYYNDYKDGGKVDAIIVNDGFPANKTCRFEFKTEGKYDRVSLLMKLSPSPDWFVSVNNVNLNPLLIGGSITFLVFPMDAGLFSGTTYTERGSKTDENITYKIGNPVSYPNGGVNQFAVVTIRMKGVEKIKKD